MNAIHEVIECFRDEGLEEERDVLLAEEAAAELVSLYNLLREARNFIANSAPLLDDERDLFDRISAAIPPENGEE